MQAKFINAGVAGDSNINVIHNGETLEFSGSVYQGVFRNGTYEPFAQINKYWERLDVETLDRIFELYIEAKEIFNTTYQVTPLIHQLRPIVEELIALHDNESMERWTRFHGGIWIPEDLSSEYKFSHERQGSREQTYLISDYWELVFMIMKMRCIIPIWGEFIERTKRESGPIFRYLNAYFLITKSQIEHSPAMERLNMYVAKNLKQQDGIDVRSSINGIGSETFRMNLIANIVILALVAAPLTRDPNNTHLVQFAHKALRNKLSQNDSHQNAVLPKDNPGEGGDDEDSSSRAERYKNKPLVAPGEITAVEKYTEYVNGIAARLLVKNELTLEECGELERILDNQPDIVLEECQIQLIRWVVSPIVSARALWDVNKSSVMRLAGIAQFVLWNTGFKDLAGLVTARSMNAEGLGAFGNESRAQIPKDLVEKINELFPYFRRHPTKKPAKPDNDAIREIMQLGDDLSDHTWFLNLTDAQIAELRGSAANKTYRLGYDTRVRLAELVIYNQQRNQNYISLYKF